MFWNFHFHLKLGSYHGFNPHNDGTKQILP
uniref:Uncharacterized protein n=1 Tax=Rhizophora mucronata TaxID=61149 RepID=A0A2P2PSQ3_RHIMU